MNKFVSKKHVFKFIADSSIYGNLGFFIGAGLPMAILNNDSETVALSWKQLIAQCAELFGIEFHVLNLEGRSYPEIASELCRRIAAKDDIAFGCACAKLKRTIADVTSWYLDAGIRTEFQHYFEALDPSWVITTNYDTVVEGVLTGRGYSLGPSDQITSPKGFIPVYHLHGIRTDPDSIIITQEDYTGLFRPNQYRQQKLPLILKESVTLLIGYNLGDFNVLTAVDWSRNVFVNQTVNHPHDIIQFYYNPKAPKKSPYRDINSIVIVEFDDLAALLKELSDTITQYRLRHERYLKKIEQTRRELQNPTHETAVQFIDDSKYRITILRLFAANSNIYISAFLELFFKCVELFKKRARPTRAFHAYAEFLTVLIDIMVNVKIMQMPHALIASIAENLNAIARYIGTSYGQSYEAEKIWCERQSEIQGELLAELANIAKVKSYLKLRSIIKDGRYQKE